MYRILLLHEMTEYDCRVKDYLELAGYDVVDEYLDNNKYENELRRYDMVIIERVDLKACLKAVETIRYWLQIPIVVLTENDEEWNKIKLFRAEVDDYIVAPYYQGEFLARVQAHIERYKRLTKSFGVIRVEDLEIHAFNRKVYLRGAEIDLRLKEFDILLYLAKNAGTVITKQELYEMIWRDSLSDGVDNLVAVHVKKVREKIEHDMDNPRYIETVWGVGYRFRT